jgi:hypothetical protein
VPALTPDARQRLAERTEHLAQHYAENPEDLRNADRCLVVGNSAVPPMLPVFYNNLVQIVQTDSAVLILSEMIHDVRIVALDGARIERVSTTERVAVPAADRVALPLPDGRRQMRTSFVRAWTGESLLIRTSDRMFEYACHEANYSMADVLRGARFRERPSR